MLEIGNLLSRYYIPTCSCSTQFKTFYLPCVHVPPSIGNAFSVTRKLQIGLESDFDPGTFKSFQQKQVSNVAAAVVFKMKLKIVEPDAHIKGRAASHMNVLEEVEHMLIDSHILIIIISKNLSEGNFFTLFRLK